jgi:DNA-binding MarR family transcriptional regulator
MARAAVSFSTLLSWTLVAFTIEVDNEVERRLAEAGPRRAFGISHAFWANYVRFVRDDGMPARELHAAAGFSASDRWLLGALERWGYITVDRTRPRAWTLRPTATCLRARSLWQPVPDLIERRWRERFGAPELDELRASLESIESRIPVALPHYVPLLGYGFASTSGDFPARELAAPGTPAERFDLPALLSHALHSFALEYEARSTLSLPLGANVLRILDGSGVPVRELPARSGVSREGLAMATGFLASRGLATLETGQGAPRVKIVRLTESGLRAREAYEQNLAGTEERMAARFGSDELQRLRKALTSLVERREDGQPLLARGLEPPPGAWRGRPPYLAQTEAMLRDPAGALPHYPLVLHRGGWPDGS